MSRKEESDKIEAVVRALLPDDESTSDENLRQALQDLGCDRPALHRRVRETADRLAAKCREAGRPAPPYLKRVADALAAPDTLPADPVAANSAADEWITGHMKRDRTGGQRRFLKAARRPSGTSPSPADDRVLDELRQDLQRELDEDDGGLE